MYLTLLSLVAALGGLLFGYDTAVISGAIGFMQAHFQLTATATGWAASCTLLGCVVGAALAGTLSDHVGRRWVLVLSAVLFLVSAIGTALPRNLTEFVVFRMICGLAVGAASITSPMYIAEISPARLRGRMVSVNQFAIVCPDSRALKARLPSPPALARWHGTPVRTVRLRATRCIMGSSARLRIVRTCEWSIRLRSSTCLPLPTTFFI